MPSIAKIGKHFALAGLFGLMLTQPVHAGLFNRLLANNSPAENPAELLQVLKFGRPQDLEPVKKIMIGEMNIEVGIQLERLTLLSGEGNMGKKIAGGLMAGALTMLGGSGGTDTAFREPIAEHLKPEDAQFVANEIAQIFNEEFHPNGIAIVNTQDVAKAPFYTAIKGDAELKDTLTKLKERDIEVGYYRVPAGGLKYREKPFLNLSPFGSDSEISPHASEVDAQGNVKVELSLYNDKEYMRLENFSIAVFVSGSKAGESSRWMHVSLKDPHRIAVKTGDEKLREHWPEMRKVIATLAAETAKNMAVNRPATGNELPNASPPNTPEASGGVTDSSPLNSFPQAADKTNPL